MQQFIVTDNPILYVPNDWQDLGGNPANSPALVEYVAANGAQYNFIGSGGTQVFGATGTTATTVTIYSTPPTGTSVQFIDVLGNATDNVSLVSEFDALQTNIDGKSGTGHTHSYTGGTITDLPTLGTISTKNFWSGSQTAYNAIGSPDANTLYFITSTL